MFIGIDPSLSNTGVVILSDEGDYLWADQIPTDKAEPIHVRCRGTARQILNACSKHEDCKWDVFIESPGGALQGQAGDLRTLFWFIVEELTTWERATVSIYSMAPNGLTKWITGSGSAKAGDKAYHVSQKYMQLLPNEFHATDATKPKGLMRWADLWDGLCLCLVGRQYMGLDEGNQKQKEAVQGIKKIV